MRAPGPTATSWRCQIHGDAEPYVVPPSVGPSLLASVAGGSSVPVWLPTPMPYLWGLNGVAYTDDERGPFRACAVAISGPSPLGGPVDVVLVSEEPGVGLGAGLAGLSGPDPGLTTGRGEAIARLEAGGHETPLWTVLETSRFTALAGEADGVWLWVLAWSALADVLIVDDLALVDLRDVSGPRAPLSDIPYGAVTQRLVPAGSRSDNTA